MTGWVSIQRDLFRHDFFSREPMSEREAWIWLIANAAWADTRHKVGQVMIDVPRGSLMVTLRELQAAWMWGSDSRVRNFLKRMESERMVVCKVNAKGNAQKTHITICKYDEFQAYERTPNAKQNARRTHAERTKETIEQNNKEEAIASSRPATAENPAVAALAAWASPAAVASFIAYRRKAKGGFTLTAAKRLAENLKAIFNGGGDPDDALGMAEERGWQTIKPEWYFREKSSGDGNRNRQAESSGDRQLRLIAVAARSL